MSEMILFLSTVICLALVFSLINDPRGNQWKDVLNNLQMQNAEINWLKKQRDEFWKELAAKKVELTEQKNRTEELKFMLTNFKDEIMVFRDQLGETREKQIVLREILSAKRPVIKVSGPVPIKNVETGPKKKNNKLGKGLKSIFREV